ncbi:MAG: hypothetical protein JWM55_1802 [Acidimicrobiaceae bacterium]|nr:hypothetical protein [Acidimicrobiaceae bacterium]
MSNDLVSDQSVTADADRVYELVAEAAALGPRLPGSAALRRFEEILATGFAASGLTVELLPYTVRSWVATEWSLSLGNGRSDVVVSGYYPESGVTALEGTTAPLVYIGTVGDAEVHDDEIRGSLVVVDYPLRRVPLGYSAWGVHDRDQRDVLTAWEHPPVLWAQLDELRARVASAGAVGLIAVWTGTPDFEVDDAEVMGLYEPIRPPSVQKMFAKTTVEGTRSYRPEPRTELPAVWVAPSGRDELLAAAAAGGEATLKLCADVTEAAPVNSVVATLPGMTEEAIVLVTHTDGVNALQENGGSVLLAIAESLARLPLESRRRTVVFACVTGHMCREVFEVDGTTPTLAESDGLLVQRPALAEAAVVALGVEHVGCTEWVPQGGEMVPSGRNGWAHCLTKSETLAEVMLKALEGTDSDPVLVAQGPIWGMVYPFSEEGIPNVSYGALPSYLMATGPDSYLGRISKVRLSAETTALLRAVRALDGIPQIA